MRTVIFVKLQAVLRSPDKYDQIREASSCPDIVRCSVEVSEQFPDFSDSRTFWGFLTGDAILTSSSMFCLFCVLATGPSRRSWSQTNRGNSNLRWRARYTVCSASSDV